MDAKVFREYDIRGVYPIDIDDNFAYTLGKSYGSYIQEKYNKNTVIVGHDNRLSSPMLKTNLVQGLVDSGCKVVDLGLVTSPMCAYATKKCHNVFSIMVTASHNPKDDNGFKFSFDKFGMARGDMVYAFRDYTMIGKFLNGQGSVKNFNIAPYYASFIKSKIDLGSRKIKVVLDPANGTTSPFLDMIFKQFDNIDYTIINGVSDGNFPTHHPDPSIASNLDGLRDEVLRQGADLGIGYDGDGDRLGIIDENGSYIPADKLMIIFVRDLINKVEDKRFLFDVKSSKALEDEIIKLGGTPICYRVGGHSYIRTKINQDNIVFGGELSGHIVFNDRWPGIDAGIYSSLRLIEVLSKTDKKLSELLDGITKYYNTPEIKVEVGDDKKFKIVDSIKKYCLDKGLKINDIDGVRVTYDDGWALVRASNTGPHLTLRFEATTEERLKELKEEYEGLIKSIL